MSGDVFWLSDEQFAKIAPLLPTKTRRVKRVDDRRVISGIIHVQKSGCRWVDAPREYGPRKTLYNRFVRWADKGVWVARFKALAIGRSRGGRTNKIHALTYEHCRPLAFLITGGSVADCTAAATLLDRLPDWTSSTATRATTPMVCASKSESAARSPTFRRRPTGKRSRASRPSSTASETRPTFSPLVVSPPPSATGYESEP